ncbi:MAG: AraC family transcriptional regulator [Armatimonadota bacterium]
MTNWLVHISPVPRIVGFAIVDRKWIEPCRVLYDHELMILGDGEGVITIDRVAYLCPPNSYIIIPPALAESSRSTGSRPWHRHWVHFDWTYQPGQHTLPICAFAPQAPASQLFHLSPSSVPQQIFQGNLSSPTQVLGLFNRLERRWNEGTTHDRLTCRGLLLELLIEILDTRETHSPACYSEVQLTGQIRLALDELSLVPASELTRLPTALRHLGYSYAHLTRVFHRAYGMSPLGYLNALRIERAKYLLQESTLAINEIADRVGIGDPAYFSRLFKKYTGSSPTAFLRASEEEQHKNSDLLIVG